jgi:hypothetical protein
LAPGMTPATATAANAMAGATNLTKADFMISSK